MVEAAAAAAQTADCKWSEKKMEGEEGLRTLELLRGRLQAERAASRKAKEDAESKDNKLKELEQQLKKEIKARKREEKRLNSLMKKLQSLNIVYTPSGCNSEESSELSSFNSESSFCISSTGSTGFINVGTTEEEQEENLKKSGNNGSTTKVVDLDNVEEIDEGEGKSSGLKDVTDSEENSCSKSSDCRRQNSTQKSEVEGRNPTQKSDDEGQSPSQKTADSNSDDRSMKSDSGMGNTTEVEDDVGNTMALVLVNKTAEELEACSSANNTKEVTSYSTSEDVRQVLDTLKEIRERLLTSIGDRRRRSHIIKVG